MIEVKDFKPEHLESFLAEERHAHLRPYFHADSFKALEEKHQTKTIMAGDKVLLVGGILDMGSYGEAWAMVDRSARQYFMSVHRLVANFLRRNGTKPVAAMVDINFTQAHKWMSILGFQRLNDEVESFGVTMCIYKREAQNGG